MNGISSPINSQPQPTFSLTSGVRVLDRYTIQRGLGVGGFGEVYFAISDAGKEVAIKRIQRNREVELRGVSHCLNLKHANLISLHDVCQDADGHWWVVMEYVSGGNLREALDRSPGGLSDAEVRRWFLGAAHGLDYLHSQGLVHRDLKPGNLFDDSGVIKLGDYGLSKYISESRRGAQTDSVGTFHYMAPEIGRGDYGHEIDLYALGVILYEMLTDRLPLDGDTIQEIVVKHLSAEPDLSGIAPPYRHVIHKALQKDPRQRWATAGQMAAALNTVPLATLVSTDASPRHDTVSQGVFTNAAAPQAHVPQPAAQQLPYGTRPQEQPVNVAAAAGGWEAFRLPPIAKLLAFVLVAALLIRTGRFLLPAVLLTSAVYVPLYVYGQLRTRRQRLAAAMAASPFAGADVVTGRVVPPRPPQRLSRKQWRQQQRARVAAKPVSTQFAELSGSWLAAAIVTLFCTVGVAAIGLRNESLSATAIAGYAWVGVFAYLGTIGLLAVGKLWEGYGAGSPQIEGSQPSPAGARLVLLGVGGALGLAGFALHRFLLLPLEPLQPQVSLGQAWQQAFYDSASQPRLAAWVMHFALLLSVVRWWRYTDPLRSRRLRFSGVVLALVAAWAVQLVVPIPQPLGWLAVGTIAIATQIAAAWENNDGYLATVQSRGNR